MNVAISKEAVKMYEEGEKKPTYTIKILHTSTDSAYFGIQEANRVIGYIVLDIITHQNANISISMFNGERMSKGFEALNVIMSYAFAILKFKRVSIISLHDNRELLNFIEESSIGFSYKKMGGKSKFSTTISKFQLGASQLENSTNNRWTYARN